MTWQQAVTEATRVTPTPAQAESGVALGNWVRCFPRSPSPTSDSGPGKAQRKGTSQRDSCGNLGPRRRPSGMELSPGTHPPAHSLLLGEAKTTAPNMPCGGWPTVVRPVAQGAHGSCSSLLFGGLKWFHGWAWEARALGCLRRKNRRTPPPCFRSPQPRGLQRPIRLRTQVASATALVSQIRDWSRGKVGPGFTGAGFGRVCLAGGKSGWMGSWSESWAGMSMEWKKNRFATKNKKIKKPTMRTRSRGMEWNGLLHW